MTMFFGVVLASALGLHAEGGAVALPLLATQLLWVNLVTDGAPALALGVDSTDAGGDECAASSDKRRNYYEAHVVRHKFVGAIIAAGTLFVLDASLSGGRVEGHGGLRYAQTMAFTTLVTFQLFNVFNARSDEKSAFAGSSKIAGLGKRRVVSRASSGSSLCFVFATGIFNGWLEPWRLVGLRGRVELNAVDARTG